MHSSSRGALRTRATLAEPLIVSIDLSEIAFT
jgi:hypothetical protein